MERPQSEDPTEITMGATQSEKVKTKTKTKSSQPSKSDDETVKTSKKIVWFFRFYTDYDCLLCVNFVIFVINLSLYTICPKMYCSPMNEFPVLSIIRRYFGDTIETLP